MSEKNGEYTLSKTIIISQNVPLDMWKVVLRTLPIDFCHTVEKTSAQNQKTIMKLSLFCKRSFLWNSFSTYRKQFQPTCRNVSLQTWNFFTQSLKKIMNLLFPKKKFPLDANKAVSTTVPKSLRQLSQFSTQIPGPLMKSSIFWKLMIFPKSLKTFRSMTKKDTQIDYFFAFFLRLKFL